MNGRVTITGQWWAVLLVYCLMVYGLVAAICDAFVLGMHF